MDNLVNLGLVPAIHIFANGALTFDGPGEAPSMDWDFDAPVLTLAA